MAASKKTTATADRVRQLFIQWNIAGQWTQLFESWPDDVQCDLRQAMDLDSIPADEAEAGRSIEQPLVACRLDDATWTLLTDQRLMWRQAGRQMQLLWQEIGDVNIDDASALRRNPEGPPLTQRMLLIDRDGAAHALELEAGPPFSWFWMALKMIARGNDQ